MIETKIEPISTLQHLLEDMRSHVLSKETETTLESSTNEDKKEKSYTKNICSLTKKIRFKWVY